MKTVRPVRGFSGRGWTAVDRGRLPRHEYFSTYSKIKRLSQHDRPVPSIRLCPPNLDDGKTRGKKPQAQGQQTAHVHSTVINTPLVESNPRPSDNTTNKQIEDNNDSVEELLDANSIPGIFRAKKKARSSHIWLPENRLECIVNGSMI